VGADRIAATATRRTRSATYMVAVLAQRHGLPSMWPPRSPLSIRRLQQRCPRRSPGFAAERDQSEPGAISTLSARAVAVTQPGIRLRRNLRIESGERGGQHRGQAVALREHGDPCSPSVAVRVAAMAVGAHDRRIHFALGHQVAGHVVGHQRAGDASCTHSRPVRRAPCR